MKNILCNLGFHKHLERQREVYKTEPWERINNNTGEAVRKWIRKYIVVIKVCECGHKTAYTCYTDGDDKDDQNIQEVHPDYASELMFTERL